MSMKLSVVFLFGLLVCAADAKAGMKMTIPCQQSLLDGRVLVDGTLLPEAVRYKVLSYKPRTRADGWSYGECVLDVTKGVS